MTVAIRSPYAWYRFQPGIISHAVWLYFRFPLAASSIASKFSQAEPGLGKDAIALALLAIARVVIAGLLGRTLDGIARGQLQGLSL